MATNEYLPWAYGAGANVEDPATYTADAQREDGFEAGIARSIAINTALRQATVAAAALAENIADVTGVNVEDDGSVANFQSGLSAMLSLLGGLGSGGLFGLNLSNTGGSSTTQVTISTGQCRDSLNGNNIILVAPITKTLTSVWAVGTGNGGRDNAAALAAAQTYHVFMILNPTSGVVDALFSQSPTSPTLPAGYTKFRRVGSILLEAASTAIRQFVQTGDWFKLKIRSTDFAATPNGVGPYLRIISVPSGIKVEAEIYFQSTGTANTTVYHSGVYDPDFGVPPAFGAATQWAQVRRLSFLDPSSAAATYGTVVARQFTDTSKQVYTFSSDSADVIAIGVLGWRDDRGRFL